MFPLMAAVEANREPLVQFLVKNGAHINAKTKDGYTALGLAENYRLTGMIALLTKPGARPVIKKMF
jgi:ankyrin repeat protein